MEGTPNDKEIPPRLQLVTAKSEGIGDRLSLSIIIKGVNR